MRKEAIGRMVKEFNAKPGTRDAKVLGIGAINIATGIINFTKDYSTIGGFAGIVAGSILSVVATANIISRLRADRRNTNTSS